MKRILSLFTLSLLTAGTWAQDPDIVWQKSYGSAGEEFLYSMVKTADGGFVAGGSILGNVGDWAACNYYGNSDAVVVKLDATGAIEWAQGYGGSGADWVKSITPTTGGGYAFVAWSTSTHAGAGSPVGSNDAWLVKLDASGNIQWDKYLGGNAWEDAEAIVQTLDKGYVITGRTYSTDITDYHDDTDGWVVKTDSLGNVLWSKCYGDYGNDYLKDIKQLPDSGFIVTGYDFDYNHFGINGHYDIWTLRLDKNGNVVWEKFFGGTSSEQSFKVELASDGNYMLSGLTASADHDMTGAGVRGYSDAMLMKISPAGSVIWVQTYGSSDGVESGDALGVCSDGGFLIGGRTTGSDMDADPHLETDSLSYHSLFIVKTDMDGNRLWSKTLGGTGSEYCSAVNESSTGGYVIGSNTKSSNVDVALNNGNWDYWIFELSKFTAVEENEAGNNQVNIYPNPSTGTFNINGVSPGSLVNIIDATGQLVHTSTVQNNQQTISAQLAPGLYICTLSEGEKITGQAKLVVK